MAGNNIELENAKRRLSNLQFCFYGLIIISAFLILLGGSLLCNANTIIYKISTGIGGISIAISLIMWIFCAWDIYAIKTQKIKYSRKRLIAATTILVFQISIVFLNLCRESLHLAN